MSSFKDLIPLPQRAGTDFDISLARPDAVEVAKQTQRTKDALAVLISGASAAQQPSRINKTKKEEPTYVSYEAASQFGKEGGQTRIIKISQQKLDPMEPPKWKHKKVPHGPPSPPRAIMHSPPRKLTAEDQANWRIPPSVSSWKNPKGFTRSIDKLLVSRPAIEDITINDRFSGFAEALGQADRMARAEVQQRAAMQQKLAEKEKAQKEDHLRMLAQKAREERSANARRGRRDSGGSSTGGGRRSERSYSRSASASSADSEAREREQARRERKQEREKQLRQSRMGTERRMQMMAREQGRDISEKIALGIAKPTASSESMYDSRLFNQSSGFDVGFNEDNHYDKPLFAAQDTINSIYRPTQAQADEDEQEAAAGAMDKITKSSRFEVLGKAAKGFRGADIADDRRGPVVFERDRDAPAVAARSKAKDVDDDPFGIDEMIREATGGKAGNGKKRSGAEDEGRAGKKARVESDED